MATCPRRRSWRWRGESYRRRAALNANEAEAGRFHPRDNHSDAHVPGHTFLLKSKRIGAVSIGSPIFYRDLSVGEVLGWGIADMAEFVAIHAFIRAPYDGYVHDQTRFWNASGFS